MAKKECVIETAGPRMADNVARAFADEGLAYKCTLRVMKGSFEHEWLIGQPHDIICGLYCNYGDGADVYVRFTDPESDLYIRVDVFEDARKSIKYKRRRMN